MSRRLVRPEHVVFTRVGDSAVLLDSRGGGYFSLSDVGARIWQLCDGENTPEDVADRIAEEYDAPIETIRDDTARLVDDLLSEGLLNLS